MQFVADLHVHSKHSRATSKDCDLENLAWWAARKGIAVVGTGDFTHPGWFEELQTKLVAAEPGLYRLRPDLERAVLDRLPPSCRRSVRFMLSVEISTIYKRDDRTRKVHHLLYMPDFEAAAACREKLDAIGNLRSDGRPILGLDSRHLLEITLESGGYLVPAHIWTPWFAVMGSQSGFDAIDDCYGELASHVFALETGLSSDPEMNWRVSSLDRFRLVSNSDAHSPPALGREATTFDTDIDYFAIKRSLETGVGLAGTIEFFPEEGKYHLDGHRKCGVTWQPAETIRHRGVCRVCGKQVTVGVLHRVETLADRPEGFAASGAPPFRNLISLPQIFGELHRVGPKSKRVMQDVLRLTERLGPELEILQSVPLDDIGANGSSILVEAIDRLRRGSVSRSGGSDGEYGVVRLFEPGEVERHSAAVLFDLPQTDVDVLAGARIDPSSSSSLSLSSSEAIESESADAAIVSAAASLNAEQQRAVKSTMGPVLIVAGPGTGKTRVIAERFVHMITNEGVDPARCLAITFTRRAAQELGERLTALTPSADAITVTTFHGLGLSMLRAHGDLAGLTPDFRVANAFETVDKAGIRDVVDFDDLIELSVRLLEGNPEVAGLWQDRFRWIAVDEYQDVDGMQYRLLRLLTAARPNICVVGDPDQAIYGFRGADVGFFLRFEQDFPDATRIGLIQNYRSSAVIVEAALDAIAPSSLVPGRQLRAATRDALAAASIAVHGAVDESREAEFVTATIEQLIGGTSLYSFDSGRADRSELHLSFADFAVLYRTDAQAGPLLSAFAHAGIPAQKRSHNRLIDRKDVVQFARFISNETQSNETQSNEAQGNETQGPIQDVSIASRLEQFSDDPDLHELLTPLMERHGGDRQGFIDELAFGAEIDTWDPRADRVSLLTLHAAKGLEFLVVFVVGLNDGLMPLRWGPTTDLDEERRLFFVGMTRARSHLYLTHAARRSVRPSTSAPSPFLDDLRTDLIDLSRMEQKPKARQLKLL